MDKSYKNLLQEYCQKNKCRMPIYSQASKLNSSDNNPIWTTNTKLFNDMIFHGTATTVKEAESIAAKSAYEYIISNIKTEPVNQFNITQKVGDISDINLAQYANILLVDGENCDLEIGKVNAKYLILIFVSKNTTKKLVFQLQSMNENCFVFISDSVAKDAADHLLTFYAGKLSMLCNNKKYYVLTKDHYGECLEKFMNNCKFICSIDEIS